MNRAIPQSERRRKHRSDLRPRGEIIAELVEWFGAAAEWLRGRPLARQRRLLWGVRIAGKEHRV